MILEPACLTCVQQTSGLGSGTALDLGASHSYHPGAAGTLEQIMDILLAILMGTALSAACGFRVFVPLFVAAIGVRTGDIQVIESFKWIASDATIVLLGVATAMEILAYYVPWVDNALDTIATPAAMIAGTLVTASFIVDVSPTFRWTMAAIAGGGVAGAVQMVTVTARALSTATTGGLGNPIVSTTETAASTFIAVLTIVLPILAGAIVLSIVGYIAYRLIRRRMQATEAMAQLQAVPVQVRVLPSINQGV